MTCPECELKRHYKVQKIGQFPSEITESSGLVFWNDSLYTLNDSGNDSVIFRVNPNTYEIDSIIRIQHKNRDWEALEVNENGLIIADIGNNLNNRKNLQLIYLDSEYSLKEIEPVIYPDQNAFPPQKQRDFNYDAEAVFHLHDHTFIIPKNRINKTVNLYKVSDSTTVESTFRLPVPITDVALNGVELAILTYGAIAFGKVYYLDGKLVISLQEVRRITTRGQTEAIAWESDSTLLMSNERGRVFRITRSK